MTSAHILYIPTIFFLGFLAGTLFGRKPDMSHKTSQGRSSSTVSSHALLSSFIIFALVFIGTHFFHIPRSSMAVTHALGGLEIFDKKPSYSSDEVYARMAAFPSEGLALYQQFTYTIDILFPITLFVFLFLLSRYTISRDAVATWRSVLIALPIIWLGLDFLENASVYYLIEQYPTKIPLLGASLGYITTAKFSFLLFSILTPAVILATHKKHDPLLENHKD